MTILKRILLILAAFALAIGLLLITRPAHGGDRRDAATGDRLVRIYTNCTEETCHLRTGSVVAANQLLTILFVDAPCMLNVATKHLMHRAWQALGAYQLGCWGPTADEGYIIVNGLYEMSHQPYWELLPLASLHPDGTATIIEPNFSLDDYMTRVNNRKVLELLQRAQRDQKP